LEQPIIRIFQETGRAIGGGTTVELENTFLALYIGVLKFSFYPKSVKNRPATRIK